MAIVNYGGEWDICRDTNVLGPNVYADNGQGCGTIWYESVPQAREIINKWGYIPTGKDAGLCQDCKCHYSFNTPGLYKSST